MKKFSSNRIHIKLAALILCLAMILGVTACKGSSGSSGKDKKDEITIGWVMPFTGALAEWTHSIKFIEEKALDIINNKNGGIYIKEYDKKVPVRIIWGDSQSDQATASEVARKLVLDDKVDFLVGMVTPDTINPVSAVAEANKVPALMISAPDVPWLGGGPYTWTYAALFSVDTMMKTYTTAMTKLEGTNKRVGIVFDNSVDGVTMSGPMMDYLREKGFTVIDPGRFPAGTTDYTTLINKFKEEDCDLIAANLVDPDFATMLKQFHQQGYVPKLVNTGKSVHFSSGIEALGVSSDGNYLGTGILTDTLWEPYYPYINSLSGQTAAQMKEDFEAASANNIGDTTLGTDWGAFEIIYDVFTRAQTVNKDEVLKALAATDFAGSLGQVKFAENHLYLFPIVAVQLVRNEDGRWVRSIVSNDDFPDIPLSDTPMFPIPGSR